MNKIFERIERFFIGGTVISFLCVVFLFLFVWEKKKSNVYIPEEDNIVVSSVEEKEIEIEEIIRKENKVENKKDTIRTRTIRLTIYNPVGNQCSGDPWTTADNSKISEKELKAGNLKWVAVSRDILEETGYGKRVQIICESDPSLSGVYEIHDTMNKRHKNSIDILFHHSIRSHGCYDAQLEILKD